MGVWIDTDMGFDDMAAILMVEHSGIAIDGVSLVFGNAPLPQVRANASGAAAAFGWRFPIHAGRDLPVLAPLETAQRILGETGIRTLGRNLSAAPDVAVGNAFEAICAWLGAEGPHRILALGPLTNMAALVLARPDLAARITELTWMGGGVTSGNHTASAEFNAYADPEALAIVLSHGLPLTMVDLDICRKVLLAPGDAGLLRTAGGANGNLLADLFGGYVDIAISRGRPAMAAYDPTAAAVFLAPEIATLTAARIDVELQGRHTRGRTVVETRSGREAFNARYVSQIDAAMVREMLMTALLDEARS
jgi:purine nucleosidase